MKRFEVKIFYSGYCSYNVDACSEIDAIKNARNLSLNKEEILSNLENWQEADEAIEVKSTLIKE